MTTRDPSWVPDPHGVVGGGDGLVRPVSGVVRDGGAGATPEGPSTPGLTLTDFLLARIAEDEDVARRGISGQADPENGWGLVEYQGLAGLALSPHVGHIHERVQGEHVIRWHPARVLAECEAKRRILERAVALSEWDEMGSSTADDGYDILGFLALPYADHPDYRQWWKQG
jgi:hypothetical protein